METTDDNPVEETSDSMENNSNNNNNNNNNNNEEQTPTIPTDEPLVDKPGTSSKTKFTPIVQNVDAYNSSIYALYAHGEFQACKSLIGEQLHTFGKRAEFAMYMRGIIDRYEGNLEDAIHWFLEAHKTGKDPRYYTELGRCNFLLGKHHEAIAYCEKAITANHTDAKAFFWLAKALLYLKTNLFNGAEKARDILLQAPIVRENASLLVFLGELQGVLDDNTRAVELLKIASEREPENLDILTKLGTYYIKIGAEDAAFAAFGKALTYDPSHMPSILAAGGIIQEHGDHDVALNKYRVAAQNCDYCAELWNNISVCYFAKGKLAAAHSLLKKAAYLKPLCPKINFNLGLVHISMGLYCSALHFLRAAATLKKDDPEILGTMAVALSHMKDVNNARRAYEKAASLGASPQTLLNFAVFEYNHKNEEGVRTALEKFAVASPTDTELISKARQLERAIKTKTDE